MGRYHSRDYGIPPVIDYGSRWGGSLFFIGNLQAFSELELSILRKYNPRECGIPNRLQVEKGWQHFLLIRITIQVDLTGSITNCRIGELSNH